MTIRLRPHHLLCVLTYVGRGYSPAFVLNYDAIAARLSAGEAIELVEGPDDICAPVLDDAGAHCGNRGVAERDRRAALDLGALLGRTLLPGARVDPEPELLARLRAGFHAGGVRAACGGCEWSALCDRIAAEGFPDVKVTRPVSRENA